MKRLEGKTVLITGGAQGIGFAVAEMFAKERAQVVIADGGIAINGDFSKILQ